MFSYLPSAPGSSALQPSVVNTCHAGLTVLSQISKQLHHLFSFTVDSQEPLKSRASADHMQNSYTYSFMHIKGRWYLIWIRRRWILPHWGYVKPGFASTGRWSGRKIKLLSLCAAEVRSVKTICLTAHLSLLSYMSPISQLTPAATWFQKWKWGRVSGVYLCLDD